MLVIYVSGSPPKLDKPRKARLKNNFRVPAAGFDGGAVNCKFSRAVNTLEDSELG